MGKGEERKRRELSHSSTPNYGKLSPSREKIMQPSKKGGPAREFRFQSLNHTVPYVVVAVAGRQTEVKCG